MRLRPITTGLFANSSFHPLYRFAIACTDALLQLACDCGTICQIVPHTQLQTDLGESAATYRRLSSLRKAPPVAYLGRLPQTGQSTVRG